MLYAGFLGLALLALVFVLWPLAARGGAISGASRRDFMRELYRQRVDEVAREADETRHGAELVGDLEQVLLREAEDLPDAPAPRAADLPARWLAALALIVVAAALGLYVLVADPGVRAVQGAEVVLQLPASEREALQGWRTRLSERVAQMPADAKSLYLLAHTLLKLEDYSGAAEAFARTHQLQPADLAIQVYWLQARYLAARGVLDATSTKLARDILAQSPNLPVVLEILALDAVRNRNAPEAVKLLHRALTGSADVAQQTAFAAAIRELRKQFDLPGLTVAVRTAKAPPQGAVIYVIARPPGGGMPYAVVKRPAVLSPLTVRLDDLVAMSEGRSLSQAPEVEVVVRLSLSGQPMAQPGDWAWQQVVPGLDGGEPLEVLLEPPAGGD